MKSSIAKSAIEEYQGDRTRLMDILLRIQSEEGYITQESAETIMAELNLSRVDLDQTVSFYHFLSYEYRGEFPIYLNDSIISEFKGREEVAKAFEKAAGCRFGEVSADGKIGLFNTPCIGMSDQEPAAIIGHRIVTNLTPYRAKAIIESIQKGVDPLDEFKIALGDGMNASEQIKSMVRNNIQYPSFLLRPNYVEGQVLKHKLAKMSPIDVLEVVKSSELRGRGGAGFPTGLKWQFCREAVGNRKFIFCNADEGEPGTFKDRVLLTEKARMMFEGMIIAGYAVGAEEGVIYVRYEYKYLENHLENVLASMRSDADLGKNAAGIEGFNFDIRIQFGGGSYVCGEESALLESAEGKRGEPRNRPPFPVESGYLGCPTVVNNVETFCAAVNILEFGGEWYAKQGVPGSTGTKLLSISGNCRFPGIYEMEWGFSVNEILEICGGKNVQAVQVGGPSGALIGPELFNHKLSYSELGTGGSFMIFDHSKDIFDIILNFTDFFIAESCGSCVPCRNIPTLLKQKLIKIRGGMGTKQDIKDLENWSKLTYVNRCGLGHTATNPVISVLQNFRHILEDKINPRREFSTSVDIESAVQESCDFVKRDVILNEHS